MLILGALAVLWVMFVVPGAIGHLIGNGFDAAFSPTGKGVVVTSCGPDTRGHVEIRGTVRNNNSTPADYFLDVAVQNQLGTKVADGNAAPANLVPGMTAQWTAPTKVRFRSGMTCQLDFVVRLPAPRS